MGENKFLYKSAKHSANLNNMRLNNKWCDVTITVDKTEFRVHKVILAANLKYFETMLSNDSFQESKQNIIPMEGVEVTDFEAFISYAYTGEVLLTDSNALDLLELANYLGEDDIKDACIEFLGKHLKIEQACHVFKFAETIDCFPLKNSAKKSILSNFENCSQITDFLDLDYVQLVDILTDAKNQPAELQQKFFEGIIKWIMYDGKSRSIYTINVLSFIDLKKIAADCLIKYLYEKVVNRNNEYSIMRDVMFCYYSNNNQEMKSQTVIPKLVVIGINDQKLDFQFCNLAKKKWSSLQEIPYLYDNIYSSVAILNNELYYISENFQGIYLTVFNPEKKRNLTVLHSSIKILRFSTLYASEKFLYLCGGWINHNLRSNQILKYDPQTNLFETLTPIRSRRSRSAVIYYQGFLHVLGGYDGKIRLNSVEKYDPEIKQWTTFPSMCELRSGHAVGILDGKLYACGGFENNSVEVYDPSENSWQLIARMIQNRHSFLVVAHESKLLAIGGDNRETVEVYDPSINEWHIDAELSAGLDIISPQGGIIPSNCVSFEP